MKIYALLIVSSLTLVGFAGVSYWSAVGDLLAIESTAEKTIDAARKNFVKTHKPLFRVDLSKVESEFADRSLISSALAVPHDHIYPYDEVRAAFKFAISCDDKDDPKGLIKNADLQKVLLWHHFTCGKVSALPEDFFATKPFMHPSGNSFAFLYAKGRFAGDDNEWITQHLNQFHAIEFAEIKKRGIALSQVQNFFAELDLNEFSSVVASEGTVLTKTYVLVRDLDGEVHELNNKYLGFSRQTWGQAFQSSPFSARERTAESKCSFVEGSVCWTFNERLMQTRAQIFVYLGIIGVLLLVGTIVELLWRRVRFMKQQKEERAFVMQNLTHELRTPVAGLGLSVEQIRADFDTLPENLQSSFLRICDDVQRLKRVIEGSTQYLRSSTTPQDLFLKKKNIASVNDFVESVIARFDEPIEFAPLAQDCSVNEDPYWFAICLQNIIQNALKHGKPPVRVELSPNLKISVIDSGNLHDVSLAELTPAFSKGAHSEGLGLGLSIVNRVIKEMGAKLTVHGAPTTFTIDLKV